MKFESSPSLRETTILKVCANLWSYSIDRRRNPYCKIKSLRDNIDVWLEMEDEIKAKIPEFGLPQSLEKDVTSFVKPLGVEILKWCEFHCSGRYLDLHIPNEFCWTSQGTIDLKRTAEVLVRDENLSQETRYKLACIYCLENDILELCLGCRYNFRKRNIRAVEREVLAFWASCEPKEFVYPFEVEGKDYVAAFKIAALRGNTVAVKYFLEKLTPTERKKSVMDAVMRVLLNYYNPNRIYCSFPKEFFPRVLCFLLSQLDAEQQMDVIKIHSSEILLCFLDWPCQSFILKIINLASDSICPYTCTCLLMEFADKVFERHEYYNYRQLFTDVWLQISESCKQDIVRDRHFGLLIIMLLNIKDAKNIRLILKHADAVRKKEILYSYRISHWLANSNDCYLSELLLRECIPLKDDMVEFKELLSALNLPDASDQVVNLLDSLICEHGKRKCTEENYGSSCKKLGAQDEAAHNA